MPFDVNAISKVSQLQEATELNDEDLLLLSQDQGDGSFISKKAKGSTIDSHNDERYIKKIDVYYSDPLIALIIEK